MTVNPHRIAVEVPRRSGHPSTPFTQAITFRAPTGTITATLSPITGRINEPTPITVTGASEAPAKVFARVRPGGGAGCAPTYNADAGESDRDLTLAAAPRTSESWASYERDKR